MTEQGKPTMVQEVERYEPPPKGDDETQTGYALRILRDEAQWELRRDLAAKVREAGMSDIGWQRDHAQDYGDRTRIVGAEDAYNTALRIIRGEQ